MQSNANLEERLNRLRNNGNPARPAKDVLSPRPGAGQRPYDILQPRQPETASADPAPARQKLNQTPAPERSALEHLQEPRKGGNQDKLFDSLTKKFPDRDQKVLAAGIRKYRENVQRGLPKSEKPLTIDDIEWLGNRYMEENQHGYLETIGKGLVRGTEGLASGVGSVTRWAGDVTNIDTVSDWGKTASKYWNKAAQEGWAAPDEFTFSGTFMENPSFKRAAGIVGEAMPSLMAAMVVSAGAAGAAARAGIPRAAQLLRTGAKGLSAEGIGAAGGATALGLLEGAPQYEEAREAGKGKAYASGVGLASTMGTALLEYIPISRILKRAGAGGAGKEAAEGAIKRIANGGAEEGMQEASQNLWQNTIAKIGYDKTRNLTEGIVEAIIGGAGAGGMAGGVFGRSTVEALDKKRKKVIDEAKKAGATEEEIQAIEKDLAQQTAQAAGQAERDWTDRVVREMSDDELVETIGATAQSFQSTDQNTAQRANRLMVRLMGEAENRGVAEQARAAAGQTEQINDPVLARQKLNQQAMDQMGEPAAAEQPAPQAGPAQETRPQAEALARQAPRYEKRVENLQARRNNAVARKQKARGKAAKKKIQDEIDGIDAKIFTARQEAARQQRAEAQAAGDIPAEQDRFPDGLDKDIADQERADAQLTEAEGQAPDLKKDERKVIFNAETALKSMRRKMRGKPNNDPGWQQVNELRDHVNDAKKRDPYALYHLHELYGRNLPQPYIAQAVDVPATRKESAPATRSQAEPEGRTPEADAEARAETGTIDTGHELSAGEPLPGTVAVMKSGKPYTKKGIDKLVHDKQKAGEAVEPVDLGNDQWGWRRVDEFDADLSDLPDESSLEGPREARGITPAQDRIRKAARDRQQDMDEILAEEGDYKPSPDAGLQAKAARSAKLDDSGGGKGQALSETAPGGKKFGKVGRNSEGKTVYQDKAGNRFIVENGVRIQAPVDVVPGAGPEAGVKSPKQLYEKGRTQYLTNEEVERFKSADQPRAETVSEAVPEKGAASAKAEERAPARPDGWRAHLMKARQVAKQEGIDTRDKTREQLVEEVDRAGRAAETEGQSAKIPEEAWRNELTGEGRYQAAKTAGYSDAEAGQLSKTLWDYLSQDKKDRLTPHLGEGEAGQTQTPSDVSTQSAEASAQEQASPAETSGAQESGYGETNTVFTRDAADKARELLRKKLGQVSTGLDPEIVQAGIQLAGYHIEAGARSFTAYSKAMMADLGEAVKSYLRSWYEAVRHYPGFDAKGMTDPANIKELDTSEISDIINDKRKAATTETEVSDEQIRASADEQSSGERSGALQEAQESGGSQGVLQDEGRAGDGAERRADGRRDEGLRSGRSGGQGPLRPVDYKITAEDRIGEGGPKQKFKDNLEALRLVKEIGDRYATPAEQAKLVKYVGWGGLPQAFYRPDGSVAKGWEAEAKELKDLLTQQEYEAARSTTQDAHYTNEPIIQGIYSTLQRMGFKGGKILEPAYGIGHFVGLMPADMRSKSHVAGAEIDPLTSKIAKLLYPNQNLAHTAFQDFDIVPNSKDAVVGNPPFGSKKLHDPKHKDLKNFSIHNYFFAKSIKALRPNGLLAMVVSSHMMDKAGGAQRQWLNKHAELLGTVRLPSTAFRSTAGTDVTTDLVFMRKRAEGEKIEGNKWQNLQDVASEKDGVVYRINEYFANHPEMMLGRLAPNKLFPGKVVDGVYDAVAGLSGTYTQADLDKALSRLPENVYQEGQTFEEVQRPEIVVSDPGFAKPYGYTLDDNGQAVRRLPDSEGRQVFQPVLHAGKPLEGKRLERFKGVMKIRDAVRRLIRAEIADDPRMQDYRKALNQSYDAFVKNHGYLNQPANKDLMKDDPTDFPLLRSLEKDFDPGISKAQAKKTGEKARPPKAEKASIFSVRTREPYRAVKKAKDAKEALAVVLREDGAVSMDRIADLYDASAAQAAKDLSGLVFKDPASETWETADTYLSGNVKKKLAEAREAAQDDPAFIENIKALEKVIPEDVPPDKIFFKIGTPWMPTSIYEQFAEEVLKTPATIKYAEGVDQWHVALGRPTGETEFSTRRMSAQKLFQRNLEGREIVVRDKDDDGKTYLNKKETDIAKDAADRMNKAFQDWVLEDMDRREIAAKEFNDKVNTTIEGTFDGSHMIFPGMGIINAGQSRDNQLRDHQKNVAWRLIQKGKGLLDHVVGSGKTFAAIAAGMEMKRMGLAKKPMYTVPNHLVDQWAADFQTLYPGANVLVIGKKDFAKKNRQEFLGRIATGEWDAVVMAHSSFGFIKMPAEHQAKFYQEQISQYEEAILELSQEEGKKTPSVKQMEKARDRIKEKLEALSDKTKDDVVDFSELGVDALFVDEAHEFKNLFYATKMTRVAGLGDPAGSKKAFDLFVKTQYLQEANNGRGVFFLTGTPVSNSIAEMYTMMRYMSYGQLKEMGAAHFDQWANLFASVQNDWQVDATGTRYKLQSQLTFQNVPGMMSIYKDFADVISTKDLREWAESQGNVWPVPNVKGGKPENVVAERSEDQKSFMDWIVHRMDNMPKDPREDNPLKATGEAMKAALDIRLIDPNLPDFPGSKVNLAVENIYDTYQQWNDRKGAQLVFCDLSVPKKAASKHKAEINELRGQIREAEQALESASPENAVELENKYNRLTEKLGKYSFGELIAADSNFSVYDDIKAKLIQKGVPEHQIAFIHDANTDKQKADLFGKVRAGRVRVLIGSTSKMGAGMNVQNKLVALHHLDAPWRPSDLEQREGRIIRQGNEFFKEKLEKGEGIFEVGIHRYSTKETLDTRRWQIIERKAKSIEQLRAGNHQWGESIEDSVGEAANAADMKAAASGNPLILEEIQLRQEIGKLESLRSNHRSQRFSAQGRIKAIETFQERYDDYTADINADLETVKNNPRDDSPEGWEITVDGKTYRAENLVPVSEETRENKKEVKAAREANESALKRAKDAAGNAVEKALKQTAKTGKEFTVTFRGVEFDASRSRHFSAVVLEPQFKAYDVYTRKGNLFPPSYVIDGTGKFADKFSATGFFSRMNNKVNYVENNAESLKDDLAKELEQNKKELPKLKERVDAPFEQEGRLEEAWKRHEEVLGELRAEEEKTDDTEAKDFSRWEQMRSTRFARTARRVPEGAAVPKSVLHKIMDAATGELYSGLKGKIEILNHESELPKTLQDTIEAEGMSGEWLGVFHKDRLYFVADNIAAPDAMAAAHVEWLLRHEGRHLALDQILGGRKGKQAFFGKVATRYKRDVDAFLKKHNISGTAENRAMAAEEVLVEKIRAGETGTLLDRFVSRVAAWVRKLFPNTGLTRADLRMVISRADQVIEKGETGFVGQGLKADPRFLFLGKKAATADTGMLEKAKLAKEKGTASREKIWKTTGWWEIVPGQWSFEIDSGQVRLNRRINQKGMPFQAVIEQVAGEKGYFKLNELIEAPALFKAYPSLMDIRVGVHPVNEAGAGYSHDNQSILVGSQVPASKLKSHLLHELQHAVQRREGFARGGSMSSVEPARGVPRAEQLYRKANSKVRTAMEIKDRDQRSKVNAEAVKLKREADYVARGYAYLTLAGEAEARLTQKRLELSPEKRKAEPPWKTLEAMLKREGLMKMGQNPEEVLTTVYYDDQAGVRFARSDEAGAEAAQRAEARREWAEKGVQSKYFKKWFGDWESAEQYRRVIEMPAMSIEPAAVDKQSARKAYKAAGSAVNQRDGRRILFVTNAFKKILGHRQRDLMLRIIPQFKPLLEKAEPIYSESERDPAKHNNIIAHHNYLSKVNDPDTGDYWVRFTVREASKPEGNELHNAFVSSVEITRAESEHHLAGIRAPGINAQSGPMDKKLKQWLGKVKAEHDQASKVVDENGGPLVVYHGSPTPGFSEFDKSKINSHDPDAPVMGFWFSGNREDADMHGRRPWGRPNAPDSETRAFYLSIKNPASKKDVAKAINQLSKEGKEYTTREITARLKESGFDGYVHEEPTRLTAKQKETLKKTGQVKIDKNRSLRTNEFDSAYVDLYDERVGGLVTDFDGVKDFEAQHAGVYVAFEPEQIKSATGNQGTFDPASPDTRFARTSVKSWPKDFANATLHTSMSKLTGHPEYKKAKAGDARAAISLVRDLVKPEKILNLKKQYPDAVVVAPHAEEAAGKNAIPRVLAEAYRDAGFEVNTDIVQSNRAARTEKDSPLRLVARPEFDGKVQAGRKYILIDDALGQGGTMSELRHFIENNGGEVAAVSALTSGIYGSKIKPDTQIIKKIEDKHGRQQTEKFLREHNIAGKLEALTQKEAHYIARQPSLDDLRDRILAAARQAGIEPGAGQVQGSVQEQVASRQPSEKTDTAKNRDLTSLPDGTTPPAGSEGARFARAGDLPPGLKASDYGAPVKKTRHSGAQIRRAAWGDEQYQPKNPDREFAHFLRTGDLPPNVTFGKDEKKMRVTQRALMLPQWMAKYYPEAFGKLYDRTKKRIETRNDLNTKDVVTLDSFWKLRGENLEAVRDVIWTIDGQDIKGVPDSLIVDAEKGLQVNEEAYPALENWIVKNLGVSKEVAKEVVQVRRVLDNKWTQIDALLARSSEVDRNQIDQFRKDARYKKNYFPHVRYGNHYIQIRDQEGEVVFRSHFDARLNLSQRRAAAKELEKIFARYPEFKNMKVKVGRNENLPEESIYDTPIPTDAISQILKTAAQQAGPDLAHAFEQILPEKVADVLKMRGFGAHTIRQHDIPGHEKRDIQKVLYRYLTGSNGWMTKMEASRDYSKILATLDAKKDPELYKASKNYVSDMLRNSDQHDKRIAWMKSLFFAKYLGASIKTPVLNLTQVIVAGTSRLSMETKRANSRYLGTTGKMLTDALNGKKTLTMEQRRFLHDFYEKGLSGAQFTEEVSGQIARDPVASGWDRFVKLLGIPMAISERFNRTTVGLAAFNIAREGKITNPKTLKKFNKKAGEALSYDEAMAFASEINTDTNFDFGRHNRPELVRADKSPIVRYVAGTGYTFRFFTHNLLSLWKWQWKQGGSGQRALMRSLAAVVAFGGLTSFPLYKTFMAMMRQLTGDDWEEKTVDKLLPDDEDMDWVRDMALYGLPTVGGTTLGSSMSMELPILSRYRVDQSPTGQGARLFAEAIGIPYSMLVDIERTMTAAYNRDPLRALESILPPVIANPIRAHRAYSEGLYTHTGRPIVLPGEVEPRRITAPQAIAKAFGFQPVENQKSWEMTQKIGDLRAYKVRKQRNFADRMAKAVHEGDFKEVRKIAKEVADWNREQAERGRFEYIIDLKHSIATRMQGRQPPEYLRPYAQRLRQRAGM